MYRLLRTDSFESDFNKVIPPNLKDKARKKIRSLEHNPRKGKVLSYDFLREIKIDKFRIYYMIYDDIVTILLIAVSNKKTQQQMIDKIKKERKSLQYHVNNFANYIKEKGVIQTMDKHEKQLLEEQNELLKKLVRGLEDVKAGRIKPFK